MQNIDITIPSTGEKENPIPTTKLEQLPQIISKAQKAQKLWEQIPLASRKKKLLQVCKVLKDKSLEYAEIISKYNGKTVHEAMTSEIFPAISAFKFAAKKGVHVLSNQSIFIKAIPMAKSYLEYSPLGVVGIISPWNYPFMLALQDVPFALMAGNAVVIKPSEFSAGIGKLIERFTIDAGLPQDLIQVIYGYGDLGSALIGSGIQHISFIGSAKTGKLVYQKAAENFITASLELGGKDAAIIQSDAPLKETVAGILWGGFSNCGQTCASIEKVFIHKDRFEEFKKAFAKEFMKLDGQNLGHMNTIAQKKAVEKQYQEAIDSGAQVLCKRNFGLPLSPYSIEGAILTDVPKDSALAVDETFGPLLPLYPFDNIQECIDDINSSPYGLTTSIWTNDFESAEKCASFIQSGVVTINDHMITAGFAEAPWGGHKMSGLGSSKSAQAFLEFSQKKYIYHDRGMIKFKFWQYPFHSSKLRFILDFHDFLFARKIIKRCWKGMLTLPRLLFRS